MPTKASQRRMSSRTLARGGAALGAVVFHLQDDAAKPTQRDLGGTTVGLQITEGGREINAHGTNSAHMLAHSGGICEMHVLLHGSVQTEPVPISCRSRRSTGPLSVRKRLGYSNSILSAAFVGCNGQFSLHRFEEGLGCGGILAIVFAAHRDLEAVLVQDQNIRPTDFARKIGDEASRSSFLVKDKTISAGGQNG